jgi:hypothetical protein
MHRIEQLLKERGMVARTIGKTDFPNVSPMRAVEQLMRQCSGAVILGFPQIMIQKGISKPGTDTEKSIKGIMLPTPWNHIESSMAFMLDLPSLVIRNQGIEVGYSTLVQMDSLYPFNWIIRVVETNLYSRLIIGFRKF